MEPEEAKTLSSVTTQTDHFEERKNSPSGHPGGLDQPEAEASEIEETSPEVSRPVQEPVFEAERDEELAEFVSMRDRDDYCTIMPAEVSPTPVLDEPEDGGDGQEGRYVGHRGDENVVKYSQRAKLQKLHATCFIHFIKKFACKFSS